MDFPLKEKNVGNNRSLQDVWNFDCPQYIDFNKLNENEDSFNYFVNKSFKVDPKITIKISSNEDDIMNKENDFVNKSTPLKESDKSESFKTVYSSPIAVNENQSDEEIYFSSQKYELRNTPTRILTENGVKVYKEPRGLVRTSSRKIKKGQKLTPKFKSSVENKDDMVLDEPNKVLFNVDHKEVKTEKVLKSVSKLAIPTSGTKTFLKPNNLSRSKDKTPKTVELEENDEKVKLDETFSLGREDICNEVPKEANKENVKKKSVRFSSQSSLNTQKVFKRLSISVPPSKTAFKTMAELIKDFEKKARIYSPVANKPKLKWRATKPVGPNLIAITRNRENRLSAINEEEKNVKSRAFKATPFNRKLFDSKLYQGITRVYPKPITKPKNYVFQSDLRIKSRQSKIHELTNI